MSAAGPRQRGSVWTASGRPQAIIDFGFRPCHHREMGRIALAVAVFAAAGLAGLGVGRATDPTPSAAARFGLERDELVSGGCGVYRWDVKTGQDGGAASVGVSPAAVHSKTIAAMRALSRPAGLGLHAPRQAAEDHAYAVTGYLKEARWEADGDFHVVIQTQPAGGSSLITEFPDPGCMANLHPNDPWVPLVTAARQAFINACGVPPKYPKPFKQLSGRVRFTGVAYFDPPNHGSGSAANGIELHPVIAVQILKPCTS
jgi:hypothetical protein